MLYHRGQALMIGVVPKPGKKDEDSEEGGSSSAGGDTDQ